MRRPRAIIFDDDQSVLALLEMALAKRGYEFLSFSEPSVCPIYDDNPSVCRKNHPCADVLLTDYNMPRMNGLELLKTQHQLGCSLPSQNKALITAYLDEPGKKALEELGCTFIAKPFRIAELSRWLEECEKNYDLSRPVAIKRKEVRSPAHLAVEYLTERAQFPQQGTVVDISPSGFRLKSCHNFIRNQLVKIIPSLDRPGATASVRWTKKAENGVFFAGLSCF